MSSKLKSTHFPGSEYVDIKLHNGNDFEMIKKHLKYLDEHIWCLTIRWGSGRNMAHLRVNDGCLERISASTHIGCDSAISIDIFTLCPYLTEFSVSNYSVKEDFIMTFAKAGTLPVLQTLGFIECKGLDGKLGLLLESRFPRLSVLNLFRTNIVTEDHRALIKALNDEDGVLSQLTSLILNVTDNFEPVIYFNENENSCRFQELFIESVPFHIRLPWSAMHNLKRLGLSNVSKNTDLKPLKQLSSLKSLTLSSCTFDHNNFKILADITIGCKLTHLDISHNREISGKLSVLLDHTYLSLDTLLLSNCNLIKQDLESLTLASVKGRLPELKHLDISYNKKGVCCVFSNDCKWDNLISIDVSEDEPHTVHGKLNRCLCSGGLRSLQELTVSGSLLFSITRKCEQLQTLRFKEFNAPHMTETVSTLQRGMLPVLRNVCVGPALLQGYGFVRLPYETLRILTQFDVFCHETVLSKNPFRRRCCLCRNTNVIVP